MARVFIDRIQIVNIKKLKDYNQPIEGNHFILSGVNGVGKSTVLDAVKRCLGIKVDMPEVPITAGEESGNMGVYIQRGDEKFFVQERITKKTSRLKFYKVNGVHLDEMNPPLERLRDIVGTPADLSPLMELKGKEQFDYIVNFFNIPNLADFEREYEHHYQDRRVVSRDIVRLQGFLEMPANRIVTADRDLYKEEKKTEEIIARRKDAQPLMQDRNNAVLHNKKVSDSEEEIKKLEKQIEEIQARIENGKKWIAENPKKDIDKIDKDILDAKEHNKKIDQELTEVNEHNKNVAKVQAYVRTEEELEKVRVKRDEHNNKMREIQDTIRKTFKQLNLGELVPGLELRYEIEEDEKTAKIKVKEAGLYLNNLPFHKSQQSYGDMLKALVILGSYLNPEKLNFLSIGEWNLLDEEHQQQILDFVRENKDLNIQLGVEKVDNSKQIVTEIIER